MKSTPPPSIERENKTHSFGKMSKLDKLVNKIRRKSKRNSLEISLPILPATESTDYDPPKAVTILFVPLKLIQLTGSYFF